MNRAQKIIVAVVLVVVAVMCLVPPWQSRYVGAVEYNLVFTASRDARGIDVARLVCQLTAVLALGGAAVGIAHVLRAPGRRTPRP